MQTIDTRNLKIPFFQPSTIMELEDHLKKDKVFQKDLCPRIRSDITSLIQYWNIQCFAGKNADRVSTTPTEKSIDQEFSGPSPACAVDEKPSDIANQIEPNRRQFSLDATIHSSEESDCDFSAPTTPFSPSFGVCDNLSNIFNPSKVSNCNIDFGPPAVADQLEYDETPVETSVDQLEHGEVSAVEAGTDVASSKISETSKDEDKNADDACLQKNEVSSGVTSVSEKLEETSPKARAKTPEKSIKKSFSSFINRVKGVFTKKSRVESVSSIKSKPSKKQKCKQVFEPKPMDLSNQEFVEAVFNRLQAPLTPNIKQVMKRRNFYTVEQLEREIIFWQEEKAANKEFFDKFGFSPRKLKHVPSGDFYTKLGHGFSQSSFSPFGGLPSPRMNNGRLFRSGYESGAQSHIYDSFLEEFESRQRGVFSYMDNYVEPPMSECESSCTSSPRVEPAGTHQNTVAKRSSGDQLLDDVWKQSEEYQEYLSNIEAEEDEIDSFYGVPLKLVAGKRNVSSSIWDPPITHAVAQAVVENSVRSHVAHSQTEVNMKTQDLVPYVKIEAPTHVPAGITKQHRIPRKKIKQLVVDINDGALYKRSVSAYSSLKDYDLAWQKTFHDEQHDIDKVQATFQSISWALYSMLRKNHLEGNFHCNPLFLTPEITYDADLWEAEPSTEWSDIFMEMAAIFERTDLTSEHAIIAFIYVQRMSRTSEQCIFDGSWQRILMLSLLTAAKVWEDCSIYNSDYSQLFPEVSTKAINQMEVSYLGYLDWNVNVKCSEFASTYFQLREPQDA